MEKTLLEIPREKLESFLAENQQLNKENERLIQQNEQLKKENDRLIQLSKEKDHDLSEYEAENHNLRSIQQQTAALDSQIKKLEAKNKYLHDLVDEKTADFSNARLELESTKRQLSDAQKMINEMERPPSAQDISLPPSEPSNSAEFEKLKEELYDALTSLGSTKHRVDMLEKRVLELQTNQEILKVEKRDLKNTLKDVKEEKLDLECQLAELRTMDPMAKQGNSMFSEVAEEYKKLEDKVKTILKDLKFVKRENNQLRDEIEEARLLATKRHVLEKIGRCVCDELKPELENERLRADKLQRTIHSLEHQIQSAGKEFSSKSVGPIFKSMFDSLKSQLDTANKENNNLRIERNSLKHQSSSLEVAKRLAESRANLEEEEVTVLKKQIEIMRHNHSKEIARLENPDLFEGEAKESAPQMSEVCKLNKVTVETPVKQATALSKPDMAKTPAIPEDPLRRLTINKSISRLSESCNESGWARKRKDKTKKAIAPKSLVSGFFEPIVMQTKDGQIVKADVPEATEGNETISIFDKPTSLPPAKFKIPSSTSLKPAAQKLPSHPNRCLLGSQSMDLGTTDLFDFDFTKSPFDRTTNEESDEENEEPTTQ